MNTPLRCLVTNAKCTEQGGQAKTNLGRISKFSVFGHPFAQANSSGQHMTCVTTIQSMHGQLFLTGFQLS